MDELVKRLHTLILQKYYSTFVTYHGWVLFKKEKYPDYFGYMQF